MIEFYFTHVLTLSAMDARIKSGLTKMKLTISALVAVQVTYYYYYCRNKTEKYSGDNRLIVLVLGYHLADARLTVIR